MLGDARAGGAPSRVAQCPPFPAHRLTACRLTHSLQLLLLAPLSRHPRRVQPAAAQLRRRGCTMLPARAAWRRQPQECDGSLLHPRRRAPQHLLHWVRCCRRCGGGAGSRGLLLTQSRCHHTPHPQRASPRSADGSACLTPASASAGWRWGGCCCCCCCCCCCWRFCGEPVRFWSRRLRAVCCLGWHLASTAPPAPHARRQYPSECGTPGAPCCRDPYLK